MLDEPGVRATTSTPVGVRASVGLLKNCWRPLAMAIPLVETTFMATSALLPTSVLTFSTSWLLAGTLTLKFFVVPPGSPYGMVTLADVPEPLAFGLPWVRDSCDWPL